jgi:two-component system phosphate regulon response regulator PhoB
MNVLLLEDNADLGNITMMILDMAGIKGIPTHILNLNDNIKQYKPELIITDYRLEYNITGDEICELIKTNSDTSHVPIILMAYNPDLENVTLKCKPDACITKPFDLEQFNKVLSQVLVHD